MKNYRVSVLDFGGKRPRVVSTRFYCGLSAARAAVPVKLSYCRNAGGFVGHSDKFEFWAFAC